MEAGTFEISAMKSSIMMRVLNPGCAVWVEVLVLLPFVLVPTDVLCPPNELEKVSCVPPLSALALILDPLVEVVDDVDWVADVPPLLGRARFDIIVVKEIPPWGFT